MANGPNFKHHVVAGSIAAVVSAGVSGLVIRNASDTRPIVVHASQPKVHLSDWPGLSDPESEALVAVLKNTPKMTISIFCARRSCEDLAGDFNDAFETAGWVSVIERPFIDTNVGINVSPDNEAAKSLAKAIESATNGRLKVGVIDGKMETNRVGLVIGHKPR